MTIKGSSIQFDIDNILQRMGNCWYPNKEQKECLKKALIKMGHEEYEVIAAIRHYEGL